MQVLSAKKMLGGEGFKPAGRIRSSRQGLLTPTRISPNSFLVMFPHRTIAPSLLVVAAVRGVASTCPHCSRARTDGSSALSPQILQHVFMKFRSISRSPMSSSFACRSGSSPSSTGPIPASQTSSLLHSPVAPWVGCELLSFQVQALGARVSGSLCRQVSILSVQGFQFLPALRTGP